MLAEVKQVFSILNSYTNTSSDPTRYKEFQKQLSKHSTSYLQNMKTYSSNAIDDIFKALDKAEKFSKDLGRTNDLKKKFGILIALGYRPETNRKRPFPIDYAEEKLYEYLNAIEIDDYEAQSAICMIDFWKEKSDAIARLFDIRELLLERDFLYRPFSLLVHLFIQMIGYEQYSRSGKFLFLSTAIQASLHYTTVGKKSS